MDSPSQPRPPNGEPDLVLLPDRPAVRVGRRVVSLTPTQYRLLAVFLAEPGRALSREALVRRGIGAPVDPRAVNTHVQELRRRLGPYGRRIEAVRGVGYRYAAGPEALAPGRKRLVFLEPGNACWSQIAEAFVRLLGMGRFEASGGGPGPWDAVHPDAARVMWDVGYDLKRHRPRAVADLPAGDYDVAVTVRGPGPEGTVRARWHEDWGLPDPAALATEQFAAVRDLIERKVVDLLQRL